MSERTNISIENKQAWDYVKKRKNQFNSKTISSELFRMINNYRNSLIDIDIANFLILMEKFYEMYSFTVKDVREELQISQKTFLQMVEKYLGDVKVYGNLSEQDIIYTRNKIHNLMIQFSIQPREYFLLHKLKTLFEYDKLSDKQKIISIIYPNPEIRRLEVYNFIILFLDEILEKKIDLKIFSEYWKDYSKFEPKFLYYKYEIEISKDDYEDDIISDILHENLNPNEVFPFYNYLIEFAVSNLIKRNMKFMKEYITQNYIFSEKLIPTINKAINSLNTPEIDSKIKNIKIPSLLAT